MCMVMSIYTCMQTCVWILHARVGVWACALKCVHTNGLLIQLDTHSIRHACRNANATAARTLSCRIVICHNPVDTHRQVRTHVRSSMSQIRVLKSYGTEQHLKSYGTEQHLKSYDTEQHLKSYDCEQHLKSYGREQRSRRLHKSLR